LRISSGFASPHFELVRVLVRFRFCLDIADRNQFVQHLLMKHFVFLLVLGLSISVLAAGGLPDKPYIYVQGKAEIEKPADIITLRFDLVGRAPEQPKANEDVQTKANKIFALITRAEDYRQRHHR
jgi:hypothetical protein